MTKEAKSNLIKGKTFDLNIDKATTTSFVERDNPEFG